MDKLSISSLEHGRNGVGFYVDFIYLKKQKGMLHLT